jgi:hypothetical protein
MTIVVALVLAVVLGFVGLAVDGGHLYVTKTELQNAADGCALAASQELAGSPALAAAAFERAEAAGQTVAARHRTGFQSQALVPAQASVGFGSSLHAGGAWQPAASAAPDARHARCTVTRAGIRPWFMQVLGFGEQTVSARATATLSPAQTACAIPMGLCALGSGADYGYARNDWYGVDFSEGSGNNYSGNFRWVDFNPGAATPGCSGGGAQELACILAGTGQCSVPPPRASGVCSTSGNAAPSAGCVGQTGSISSLETAYNSRFGLYRNGSGNPQIDTAPPDQTGASYAWDAATGQGNWPLGRNAWGGSVAGVPNYQAARAANAPAANVIGLQPPFFSNPATASTAAQHRDSGASRRLVIVPIVDCGAFVGSQHAPVRAYACVLMLDPYRKQGKAVKSRVEYLGRSDEPGSPCASGGVPGDQGSVGPLVPALVQ